MTGAPSPIVEATERGGRRRLGRSIAAVLAGLATIFAVTTATDMVLHAAGVYPAVGERMSDGLFVLAAAYRAVYGVAGSWVTARLAPQRPMAHALLLGAIGVAIGTVGAALMWKAGPAWYSLAVIAMALPCAWAGAELRLARLRRA